MSEFKNGGKVKLVNLMRVDEKNRRKYGEILVVEGIDNMGFSTTDGGYFFNDQVELIKEAEMSIRDRIEAVTGWDVVTDDLLQEILNRLPNDYWAITIPLKKDDAFIYITKYKADSWEEQTRFGYTTQSEKLEAFKKAFLYLAEKAGLLDDELKVGDYVVALDTDYWQGFDKRKIGKTFKIHRISDSGYYYWDINNMYRNCGKADLRKATPEEVEKYLSSEVLRIEIADLGKKIQELKEQL